MRLALIDKLSSCEKYAELPLFNNVVHRDKNEVLNIQNGVLAEETLMLSTRLYRLVLQPHLRQRTCERSLVTINE